MKITDNDWRVTETTTQACGDCISRQAVIDYIDNMPSELTSEKGKWIYYPKASGSVTSTAVHFYPVCSECGYENPATNFCPNCGADMRGEQG